MNTLSKLLILIVASLFTTSLFADEIMSCKVNNEQSVSFKLEENILSSDNTFSKVGTKWERSCPCEKIENKSISCIEGQNIKDCKAEKNPFDQFSNIHTIDFEIKEFRVKFYESGKEVTFKCNLVK